MKTAHCIGLAAILAACSADRMMMLDVSRPTVVDIDRAEKKKAESNRKEENDLVEAVRYCRELGHDATISYLAERTSMMIAPNIIRGCPQSIDAISPAEKNLFILSTTLYRCGLAAKVDSDSLPIFSFSSDKKILKNGREQMLLYFSNNDLGVAIMAYNPIVATNPSAFTSFYITSPFNIPVECSRIFGKEECEKRLDEVGRIARLFCIRYKYHDLDGSNNIAASDDLVYSFPH
ncbi:MAG: hypothetical protein ACE5DM_04305 [Candidatus Nanoarchaeia archaeon]